MKLGRIQFEDGIKPAVSGGFWRTFGRNWSRLISCNALFLICNIISMFIAFFMVLTMFPFLFKIFLFENFKDFLVSNGMFTLEEATDEAVNSIYYLVSLICEMSLVGFLLIINGPIQCGICYYMRNMITGDASFKADFKKGVKENWKKGLGASIISLLVTVILIFNIGYYKNVSSGTVTLFVQGFFIWCLVFWSCLQLYVYPLIACTKLSLKDVYRNAALFFLKKFFSTLGIFLIQMVLFFGLPFVLIFLVSQVGYAIAMLFYILFSFGFVIFLGTYQSWKLIQKYVKEQ
ncbi:MAG: hypothetical protein IKG93_11545 [Clostridiales bacterium]|nr:hypothetical protein [Clostridiales bacterium]